jgi:hypothetical protein
MKKFILMVVMVLLASTGVFADAGDTYAEVDREMIELLGLNSSQAVAYVAIIEKQRALFLALKGQEWEQELAFYQQTFALLKPVLSGRQYAQFVGIINSVIEDTEKKEFLVMADEYD